MKRLDLHAHVKLSKEEPFDPARLDRLLAAACRRGLDGFALTEHFHLPDYWPTMERMLGRFPYGEGVYDATDGIAIFSGAEVTCAEGVDVVLLGELACLRQVHQAICGWFRQGGHPSFDDLLDATVALPLLRIGVHMFRARKRLLPLGEQRVKRLDALSVDDVNSDAIVAESRRLGLPLTAGSDARFAWQLGAKRVLVDIPEVTFPAVRSAVLEGRTQPEAGPGADVLLRAGRALKRWQRWVRRVAPQRGGLASRWSGPVSKHAGRSQARPGG